jgi:hypothetical protein
MGKECALIQGGRHCNEASCADGIVSAVCVVPVGEFHWREHRDFLCCWIFWFAFSDQRRFRTLLARAPIAPRTAKPSISPKTESAIIKRSIGCLWRLGVRHFPYSPLRRPLSRLMTRITSATTRRRWMSPPAIWKLKPSNHRTTSTTKIVQSTCIAFGIPSKPSNAATDCLSNSAQGVR